MLCVFRNHTLIPFKLVLHACYCSWAQITRKQNNRTKHYWPGRSPRSWGAQTGFIPLANKFHPFYTARFPFAPGLSGILLQLPFDGFSTITGKIISAPPKGSRRPPPHAGQPRLSTSVWVALSLVLGLTGARAKLRAGLCVRADCHTEGLHAVLGKAVTDVV